ncbi:MAG: sortase B protein-sorting domain-containing protein, partial [Clostridium sp.]|nr:sortase B protein-sorting domain-containing protein [Clostridium sp.]
NYDNLVTTLPSHELVETEQEFVQDEVIEEDVNYDNLVTTLPSHELVETKEEVVVEEVEVEETKPSTNNTTVNNEVNAEESNYSPILNDLMLNPKTGDAANTVVYATLLVVSVMGLVFLNKKN